jgi:Ca2+/Na+ antiporter
MKPRCDVSSKDVSRRKLLAVSLPISVALIIICQMILLGPKPSLYSSWAFLMFMAAYLGWFLFRRSENREASFFSTRVRATDSDQTQLSVDWVASAGAIFLIGLAVVLPWLRD